MQYIKAWAEGKLNVWTQTNNSLKDLYNPSVKKPLPYIYYTREDVDKANTTELGTKKENFIHRTNSTKSVNHTTNYPLIFIQTGNNLGFSGGNNIGIRYALKKGDFGYIWLLNNDTKINRDALTALVETARADPKKGAVGSVIYEMGEPEKIQIWGGARINFLRGVTHCFKTPVPSERLHYIAGSSLLLKRKVLEEVGLFDEGFFLYWEDSDLCFRMRKAGWKLAVAEKSKIWHKGGASFNRTNLYLIINFYVSSVRFFRKHAPISILPVFVNVTLKILKHAIKGNWV